MSGADKSIVSRMPTSTYTNINQHTGGYRW